MNLPVPLSVVLLAFSYVLLAETTPGVTKVSTEISFDQIGIKSAGGGGEGHVSFLYSTVYLLFGLVMMAAM